MSLPTLAGLLFLVCLLAGFASAEGQSVPDSGGNEAAAAAGPAADEQAAMAGPAPGVNWKGLFAQSGFFLGAQHAFRFATEPGTREGMKGKFWPDYGLAVGNMHGWSDGDPFLVNYIGHPMQGAVSGFIWTQNDPRFYPVRFGKDRAYWESRLRASAFAFIYSAQFELGPLSEASLGKVQKYYPQQGFVDQVITPTIGMGWMIGEDAIDRFIILPLEKRFDSMVARALLRGVLNPARTFANGMRLKKPWYRDDRPSVGSPNLAAFQPKKVYRPAPKPGEGVAPFELELTMHTSAFANSGGAWCIGGGGVGKFRLSPGWQWLLDTSGCNLMGLGKHQSGDLFNFLTGAKWTGNPGGRWKPHTQFLMGVSKATVETEDPLKKKLVQSRPPQQQPNLPPYPEYLTLQEDSGLSLAAGAGLDYSINRVLHVRVGSVSYRYSALNRLSGYDLSHGMEFTAGFIIRMGTW